VLLNLILNAINAMPQGGQLTIHNFSRGPLVLITVSDTGVGISPEQQTRIFQPFTTFKYQGSGLGLSISQSIIEQFGGTITFESSVGQGTTFTIALPALQSLANYVEA
jgi:signal transduction histidine kinase